MYVVTLPNDTLVVRRVHLVSGAHSPRSEFELGHFTYYINLLQGSSSRKCCWNKSIREIITNLSTGRTIRNGTDNNVFIFEISNLKFPICFSLKWSVPGKNGVLNTANDSDGIFSGTLPAVQVPSKRFQANRRSPSDRKRSLCRLSSAMVSKIEPVESHAFSSKERLFQRT